MDLAAAPVVLVAPRRAGMARHDVGNVCLAGLRPLDAEGGLGPHLRRRGARRALRRMAFEKIGEFGR